MIIIFTKFFVFKYENVKIQFFTMCTNMKGNFFISDHKTFLNKELHFLWQVGIPRSETTFTWQISFTLVSKIGTKIIFDFQSGRWPDSKWKIGNIICYRSCRFTTSETWSRQFSLSKFLHVKTSSVCKIRKRFHFTSFYQKYSGLP